MILELLVADPTCLCPPDSKIQSLIKINNNLLKLFTTMADGDWIGNNVSLIGRDGCGCSEAQILVALNNNIADFFNYVSANGIGGSTVQAGVEALALNDTELAVVFPTAFAAAPAVVANLISPDGLSVMDVSPDESTRTTTGVTFVFGGAIPGAGWFLSWHAAPES